MLLSSDAGSDVVVAARRGAVRRGALARGAVRRGALRRAAARRGAARRALRLAVRFMLRFADRFAVFLFDAVLLEALRDLAAVFAVFLRFLAMRAP
jgi:hypothetical protein